MLQEVGLHELVVELRGPLAVQREPLDFATDFAVGGLVPIIIGIGTAEFHDRYDRQGPTSWLIPPNGRLREGAGCASIG